MTCGAAVICGIGAFVPPTLVTNEDLVRRLDTSDEWIRTRTGIEQRYHVRDGVSTSDLAAEAGRRALTNADADADSVDLIVLATTTPDRIIPATAPAVARKLGLIGLQAMDVAAVCSGFVYALQTSAALIMSGFARTALVIGAETCSVFIDPDNRTNAAIFGDGAGAMVLRGGESTEDGALIGFDCGSDGTLTDIITVRAGGSEQRSKGWPTTGVENVMFHMDGKQVFVNAVRRMSESSNAVLRKVGWSVGDVDKFVGHQANKRILHSVAERIGVPEDRTVINIQRVGNTSSASIPLALVEHAEKGGLRSGDRTLVTAFGGGATWGSAAFVWPDLKATEQYHRPE